jgi:hypothetical protein
MTASAPAERPRPDVRQAAREYIAHRWAPIPVPYRSKNPNRAEWQNKRYTLDDVDDAFDSEGNISLLTGAPSGGLLDTDLDTMEAIASAEFFLPATDMRHGREGKPSSHWWFHVPDAGDFRIDKYLDPEREDEDAKPCCLVELRGNGHHTVVPPSTHDMTGELIRWEADGEPRRTALKDLRRAVAKIAACALLASRWPGVGCRHEAALALAAMPVG